MTRLPDWEPRLVSFLASSASLPHTYGTHDCGVGLTAGAVEAMTGIDHGAAFRGRYTTMRGALRHLKKLGFADHVAFVAARFELIPPAFARKGDIGLVEGADGFGALGIVQGEGVYVLSASGLTIVSRLHLQKAFRV